MKPSEGRLQTGEHILAKVIETKVIDAKVIIASFKETEGKVEFSSSRDLRTEVVQEEIESEVNTLIQQNMPVTVTILSRTEAEKKHDLTRLPATLHEIRIVSIGAFDARPCGDPHVTNTKEIGTFKILSIERAGNNRYRFTFKVN